MAKRIKGRKGGGGGKGEAKGETGSSFWQQQKGSAPRPKLNWGPAKRRAEEPPVKDTFGFQSSWLIGLVQAIPVF